MAIEILGWCSINPLTAVDTDDVIELGVAVAEVMATNPNDVRLTHIRSDYHDDPLGDVVVLWTGSGSPLELRRALAESMKRVNDELQNQ